MGSDNCSEEGQSASEYLSDLDGGGIAVLTICSILTLIMFLIYGEELWYLYKQNSISDSLKFNRRILLGIYPVTASLSLISLFVPRTALMMDLLIILYLSVCIFIFLQMMMSHLGGLTKMTRSLSEHKIVYHTAPCCCCCRCLPSKHVTKGRLRCLQVTVLQMVFIKPLIVLFTTIIFRQTNKGHPTFQENLKNPVEYIKLLGGVTTLVAMYGLVVTFRLARDHLKGTHILLKFLCLKLCIVVIDLQGSIINMVANNGAIPCDPPRGPIQVGLMIHHILLIMEMFLLALVGCYIYRKPHKHTQYHAIGDDDDDVTDHLISRDVRRQNSADSAGTDSYGSVEDL